MSNVDKELLAHLLHPFMKCSSPAQVVVKCIAIDPMQPGDICMTPMGLVLLPPGSPIAVADALRDVGVDFLPSLNAGYEGALALWPEPRRRDGPAPPPWSMLGAAPWYVRYLLAGKSIEPGVAHCVLTAVRQQEAYTPDLVFRGEGGLYSSVSSGIARKLQTSDPDVISSFAERRLQAARKFVGLDRDGSDLHTEMQHLGDVTNKIDFSKNIWVAMYFASEGCPEEDGRVWALDTANAERAGIRVDHELPSAPMSSDRMKRQSGVLAESRSGHIPDNLLREVVRIPGTVKAGVRLGHRENRDPRTKNCDLSGHVES